MRRLFTLVALVALSLSATAFSQQRIEGTALGTFVSLSGTNRVDADVAFDLGSGAGGGVALGVDFGKLDVELSAFFLRGQGELQYQGTRGVSLGHVDLIPIMVVASFHPLSGQGFDPWIGVGGAYVIGQNLRSSDLDDAGIGPVDVQSKAAFVGNVGVAFQLSPSVAFVLDGRYIPLKLDTAPKSGGSSFELELNPLLISAGFRAKF
jgi:outer membrane protein W